MKSSDTKNNGALASYVNIIKAPAIQVLLMGTGFLLMMLFVYMGVMTSFDNTLFTTLSALGDVHGWKNDVLRDVTALGSNTVLIFVAAAVAGALALAGEKKKSLTFILAVAAGIAMTFLLKAGIDRPRPSLTMQHVDVYTQSFPSAHATLSTLVYFYIAHLLTYLSLIHI